MSLASLANGGCYKASCDVISNADFGWSVCVCVRQFCLDHVYMSFKKGCRDKPSHTSLHACPPASGGVVMSLFMKTLA